MASTFTTPTNNHAYDYDLIVIGAGPVGENVADYATKQGAKSAVVESDLVGGECSYWACMPSKALLRSADAIRAAQRLPGAREAVTGDIDASAVLGRRSSFTSEWKDDGQAAWLESAGIELIRGYGRLAGPHLVTVGARSYTAEAVALTTGSVPIVPDIPGLAHSKPWGTREATSADHIPPRLIVLGGGPAALELAFAFSSLGSKVTVLARSVLLRHEEPFAGEYLTTTMENNGIDVRCGTTPVQVDRNADNVVTATLDDGARIAAEEILVAAGRRPNTDDIGLDSVHLGAKLTVDDTMLVQGTDWLYAVGDVNGRALLTHQGKYQARAAGEAIAARIQRRPVLDKPWGRHVATADHVAVPHVVFTDPQIARVGLTEAQARDRGLPIRAVEYDLGAVAGASLHADGYTGRAKIVVDEKRHVIVGATFVGQDVAELLQSATIAIVGEVTIDRLWHAVPAYPTISEIWLRLLEAYGR
ncbi:dihydrolipoyl dehydrogenase family protein [Bifidobacterium sp.]|jgi:dihydrolipoamide dehydrogenase|uniref:dihydrolipoyl dehydrogenase family protein n=1 Tax=Bifidobacterium sp. TaxID=41200 RepID=UPI0025BC40CC|nr:NAD(P)/FAD-dependent oxidoreductase [Bifidobacterium sp.]MCH4208967.1 NAD(P)/FAD-dependent oxidoreductase [Bifidobacterium sp.]MCI1224950.1 NAD(P)/FAD-dependent oxidoreductase [Bifidobacterium sp.]